MKRAVRANVNFSVEDATSIIEGAAFEAKYLKRKERSMISHHHKAIFVHIPKCGGQSIEIAFLNDLGLSWKTRAPLLLRQNNNPNIGPPILAHLVARDYTKYHYISQELFLQYYKFALVRHPVDRLISIFNYLNLKTATGSKVSWDNFLYKIVPRKLEEKNYFFLPQTEYCLNEDGEVLLDDIFQLKQMEANIPKIRASSGLKSEVPHINKSFKTISKHDITKHDEEYILEHYRQDLKLLDGTSF